MITLTSIVEATARVAGVDVAAITGLRGPDRVAHARQAGYAVARDLGASLSEIGWAFGGRDHTTIRHGIGRADPATVAAIQDMAETADAQVPVFRSRRGLSQFQSTRTNQPASEGATQWQAA